MRPSGGEFKGWPRRLERRASPSIAGRTGGAVGRVVISALVARGSFALSLGDREIVEAEVAGLYKYHILCED